MTIKEFGAMTVGEFRAAYKGMMLKQEFLAWRTGYYAMIGFNDPKSFPQWEDIERKLGG